MSLTIALVFNLKKSRPSFKPEEQQDIEFDSPGVIRLIRQGIEKPGHKVVLVEANERVYEQLKKLKSKVDLVFNLAEGLAMDAREAWVPMICEALKIPYTHSRPTVHALGLDKDLAKKLVMAGGIRVPGGIKIERLDQLRLIKQKFPLIIKPNFEGSSKGVYNKNVVVNQQELERRVRFMLKHFGPVLVEEYIDGREFTVGLLGSRPEVLPIVEQTFDLMPSGYWPIAGYELKAFYTDIVKNPGNDYICPAKLTPEQKMAIDKASLKIFRSLGVYDMARIDWRMDKKGRLFFLEINTLPGLNFAGPDISYFAIAAKAAGYQLSDVMAVIIRGAVKRFRHA